MKRLQACFDHLKKQGGKALIPYLVAGDPSLDLTLQLMHAVVKEGADIIELGIPFSDPMADGPVIAEAHQRALEQGVTLDQVITLVSHFREQDQKTPIILMGYLNPFEKKGMVHFAKAAQAAGIDGVLIVDLPPEEAEEYLKDLSENSLDLIFLISPTTTEARIKNIISKASGYLYYVSMKGVTGSKGLDIHAVEEKIKMIRPLTSLPIAVGFGIKDAASAQAMSKISDAVIVGSAIVEIIDKERAHSDKMVLDVANFIKVLRNAIRKAI